MLEEELMDEFKKVYTDGTKEVYKRTRTKLPAIRRSLALLVLSLQGELNNFFYECYIDM